MKENIEYEFEQFLTDIKNEEFCFGRYLNESEYEDDYTGEEIVEAIEELENKIIRYLTIYFPGKFIVCSGWCVHVMTPDRARKSRISEETIRNNIIQKEEFI